MKILKKSRYYTLFYSMVKHTIEWVFQNGDGDDDGLFEAIEAAEKAAEEAAKQAAAAGPVDQPPDSDDLDLSDWEGPDPDEFQRKETPRDKWFSKERSPDRDFVSPHRRSPLREEHEGPRTVGGTPSTPPLSYPDFRRMFDTAQWSPSPSPPCKRRKTGDST